MSIVLSPGIYWTTALAVEYFLHQVAQYSSKTPGLQLTLPAAQHLCCCHHWVFQADSSTFLFSKLCCILLCLQILDITSWALQCSLPRCYLLQVQLLLAGTETPAVQIRHTQFTARTHAPLLCENYQARVSHNVAVT